MAQAGPQRSRRWCTRFYTCWHGELSCSAGASLHLHCQQQLALLTPACTRLSCAEQRRGLACIVSTSDRAPSSSRPAHAVSPFAAARQLGVLNPALPFQAQKLAKAVTALRTCLRCWSCSLASG